MTNQTTNEIIVFNPNEIAVLGNKFLGAILAHELAKEAAEREIAVAQERENFIDIELTKCALYLHQEERVDLFKVYGSNQDSAILYRSILTELGVLKKRITEDDKVEYSFTDPLLEESYNFPASLKEKDEEEYKRRRSRRNGLNIRLARCCKAAIAMVDAKATVSDLVYREDSTGQRVAVLTKGPKEVMGKGKEAVIHSTNTAKIEGATQKPTIGGLAKVADDKHKDVKSKQETETANRKETDAAANESDFLAMANAMIMAIKQREGKFADAEQVVLKNLLTELRNSGIK